MNDTSKGEGIIKYTAKPVRLSCLLGCDLPEPYGSLFGVRVTEDWIGDKKIVFPLSSINTEAGFIFPAGFNPELYVKGETVQIDSIREGGFEVSLESWHSRVIRWVKECKNEIVLCLRLFFCKRDVHRKPTIKFYRHVRYNDMGKCANWYSPITRMVYFLTKREGINIHFWVTRLWMILCACCRNLTDGG